MSYLIIFLIGAALGGILGILFILCLKICVYIGFKRKEIETDLLDDTLLGAIIDHERYIIARENFFRRFFK